MRRVSALVAILCVVAAVAILIQWAISHRRIRGWRWEPSPAVTWLSTLGDGHLDLHRTRRAPITHDQGRWAYVSPDGPRGFRLPGLAVRRTVVRRWTFHPGEPARGVPVPPSRMTFDSTVWDFRVDLWLPTLLLMTPPAVWGDRWWQRRRAARDRTRRRCVACGYDLRATAGRCPECGRPERGESEPSPSNF